MLRNIIWDVDGTLFDTYPAIAGAIRDALCDLGHDAPSAWIENQARISLGHGLASAATAFGASIDALTKAFQRRYAAVEAADAPVVPGARDVCRYVRSIGGQNVIVTHRSRAGTEELLAAHELEQEFVGLLSGDDGYPRKPDPAAFLAAMTTWHLDRNETLTVGDREIDVQAGRAAGLLSCLYSPTPVETVADLVISGFHELRGYLVSVNVVG
jgi:HAD superfamily hydrolase (TIGR01509 family)